MEPGVGGVGLWYHAYREPKEHQSVQVIVAFD